jgi:manganese transport protein
MPHVIYLHSALTQNRLPASDTVQKHRLLRYQCLDVLITMGLAGLVNISMLVIAAALFHGSGTEGTDSLEGVQAASPR